MGYHIRIKKNAKRDFVHLKNENLHKKFDFLVAILREDPFQKGSSYKKLVGFSLYSRRLTIKHRLVYRVCEETKTVIIESVWINGKNS